MHIARNQGRLHIGHRHGTIAAALGLAVMLFTAGCGSHSPSTQTSPPGPNRSPSATGSAPVTQKAMASARLIAQALADQSSGQISPLLSHVAGPVMPSYVRMHALWDEINAAGSSSPGQPGTVTSIV